ncbi:hypothetical protein KSS87_012630, partial [Heliosperma pusillum]
SDKVIFINIRKLCVQSLLYPLILNCRKKYVYAICRRSVTQCLNDSCRGGMHSV